MTKYEKIIEDLKLLIKDNTNTEQVKTVTAILAEVDEVKNEHDTLQKAKDDITLEYGKMVVKQGSEDKPDDDTPAQKSLEEIVKEIASEKDSK